MVLLETESLEEKQSVLTFVHELLKASGQPLHYTVLLDEVASRFYADRDDQIAAKARFYTWLNMDARFTSVGQGCWGLRVMAPQKGSRQVPLLTLMHKSVEYDDSPTRAIVRDDLDDEPLVDKELLEEEEDEADSDSDSVDRDALDEEIDHPVE
jgi:DNA-directed RNA polymerase delta subunit